MCFCGAQSGLCYFSRQKGRAALLFCSCSSWILFKGSGCIFGSPFRQIALLILCRIRKFLFSQRWDLIYPARAGVLWTRCHVCVCVWVCGLLKSFFYSELLPYSCSDTEFHAVFAYSNDRLGPWHLEMNQPEASARMRPGKLDWHRRTDSQRCHKEESQYFPFSFSYYLRYYDILPWFLIM